MFGNIKQTLQKTMNHKDNIYVFTDVFTAFLMFSMIFRKLISQLSPRKRFFNRFPPLWGEGRASAAAAGKWAADHSGHTDASSTPSTRSRLTGCGG